MTSAPCAFAIATAAEPTPPAAPEHGDAAVGKIADFLQADERRHARKPQGRHCQRVDVRRQRRGGARTYDDIFGVPAGPVRAHASQSLHHGDGAVSDAEVRRRGTHFHHLADRFQTRRIGKRLGFRTGQLPALISRSE